MTIFPPLEHSSGRYILVCMLLAMFGNMAAAATWNDTALTQTALQMKLHEHPQWLRLLHYSSDNSHPESEILSQDFFLSETGSFDAKSELVETLRQFGLPASSDPDKHPSCRFPARHLWLAKHLRTDHSNAHCAKFQAWSKQDRLNSISLMLISGYFGNPASTFGHVLMKINTSEQQGKLSLLDMGINYGALVPPDEPTPVYILRGLFGGYQAGFSDRDFYQYDQTYSRTEFRNMWEYTLSLSDYQEQLLVGHIWEIAGRKMRYYFLKENCAYRLGQLMELVTQESFVDNVDLWYAPISIFNRLTELDETRSAEQKYIASVKFVPSNQELLYAKIALLSESDKDLFARILRAQDPAKAVSALQTLPRVRHAQLLETLLAFYQFRLAGAESEKIDNSTLISVKNHIVRERLQLPARTTPEKLAVPARRSPGDGEPPSLLAIGLGQQHKGGHYGLLRYAPFHYDAVGNNELNRSSLVVFDTTLRLDSSRAPRLDQLDILRVRKTNRDQFQLPGTSAASWEVAVGYQQERRDCNGCGAFFAESFLGRSYDLSADAVGSASLGLSVQSGDNELQGIAQGSIVFGRTPRWSAEAALEYRAGVTHRDAYLTGLVRSRVSFGRTRELRLEVGDDRGSYAKLTLAQRW